MPDSQQNNPFSVTLHELLHRVHRLFLDYKIPVVFAPQWTGLEALSLANLSDKYQLLQALTHKNIHTLSVAFDVCDQWLLLGEHLNPAGSYVQQPITLFDYLSNPEKHFGPCSDPMLYFVRDEWGKLHAQEKISLFMRHTRTYKTIEEACENVHLYRYLGSFDWRTPEEKNIILLLIQYQGSHPYPYACASSTNRSEFEMGYITPAALIQSCRLGEHLHHWRFEDIIEDELVDSPELNQQLARLTRL